MLMEQQDQIRKYRKAESASFRSTKEKYGGLSNMAGGYPLRVEGVLIHSSEALYQACRFPHRPEVQQYIIDQRSPMTAKMVSKPYREESRSDWDRIRVRVMRWTLRVKLTMHWTTFGDLLLSTGDLPIVEDSRRDSFWGAIPQEDGTLVGMNVLGRLLMELREELRGPNREALRVVSPPPIRDFLLLERPIGTVGFPSRTAVNVVDPDTVVLPGTFWSSEFKVPETSQEEVEVIEEPVAKSRNDAQVKSEMSYPKRLIEVDLPIKRISAHAREEKDMRCAHIPRLHIYPAARPLAACRAVLCAALWPDPADPNCPQSFRDKAATQMLAFAKATQANRWGAEICDGGSWQRYMRLAQGAHPDVTALKGQQKLRQHLFDFIADFAAWKAGSNHWFLDTARSLTRAAHESLGGATGTLPLVLDPFAGGGAIPLEALRVGAEAFASDLNPVSVLLNKTVLQYIPRYGERLADEVRKWGRWAKTEAAKELARFYPQDADGATPMAYLWARTATCEGPACGAEIPLIRSLWLAKKGRRSIALKLHAHPHQKQITISLTHDAKPSEVAQGTVKRGAATCPCCGYTTPAESVRTQLKKRSGGSADARLYCVVSIPAAGEGRIFRLPTALDLNAFREAVKHLSSLVVDSSEFPDELTPAGGGRGAGRAFSQRQYGMEKFSDMFSPRQLLAVATYSRLARDYTATLAKTDPDLASAVSGMLAMVVDRLADLNASLCGWQVNTANNAHVFVRWALQLVWDFAEVNPLAGAGGSPESAIERLALLVRDYAQAFFGSTGGQAQQSSADSLPLPTDSVQAFVTDPPYYDAVPYSDLLDFFWVWIRRSMHFPLVQKMGPLCPKDEECIVDEVKGKDRSYFERQMTAILSEGRRVLAPNGVGTVVFAHKSTAGWEAQLQAMVDAGWMITASWPIDTEMGSRMRARDSAALASSVHLVCRPREDDDGNLRSDDVGDWRDVLAELPRRIRDWMGRLSGEGVVGADAIFACLGPALEIFSRHSRVEKASGEQVILKEYLTHVWGAISQEALAQIFKEADAAGFEEDARLTAMWLWTLNAGSPDLQPTTQSEATNGEGEPEQEDESGKEKAGGYALEFDAARKIAQGLGAHLEELASVVEVKGDKARLLGVAERTRHLFGKEQAEAPRPKKRKKNKQMNLFVSLDEVEAEEGSWGEKSAPKVGDTVLDRIHQSMILFAAGRGEAVRRFLVDDGAGRDHRFWKLAQALSALYPQGTDEKRWVDGVLARKKGLGL